ncbi:MAG: hypothetical protein AABW47_00810 [Nanoarchaeota archaeon]
MTYDKIKAKDKISKILVRGIAISFSVMTLYWVFFLAGSNEYSNKGPPIIENIMIYSVIIFFILFTIFFLRTRKWKKLK